MATPERTGGGSLGGIGLGGILVIIGILLAIFWSVWVGIIVALVGDQSHSAQNVRLSRQR